MCLWHAVVSNFVIVPYSLDDNFFFKTFHLNNIVIMALIFLLILYTGTMFLCCLLL